MRDAPARVPRFRDGDGLLGVVLEKGYGATPGQGR
jgi:hypothetical protein